MFTLKQAAILALVGSTFASPIAHWGGYNRQNDGKPVGRVQGSFGYESDDKVVVVVGTKTDKDAFSGTKSNPVVTTPAAVVVTSAGDDSGDSGSAGAASTQTGYMGIVSTWRSKLGLPALTESATLVKNALKTATDGNGKMVHQLNSGSFGQVLAPGTADNFEHVFVGGWLCELPNMKGLNGVCATQSKGWSHDGQTGHAEILSSTKYTKIGCALAKGIWACDVA